MRKKIIRIAVTALLLVAAWFVSGNLSLSVQLQFLVYLVPLSLIHI